MAGIIFRPDDELSQKMASDPVPFQYLVRDFLRWRYGLTENCPCSLNEDLKNLGLPSNGLTIKQASALIKKGEQAIRLYIKEGKLKAHKTPAGKLLVEPGELLRFIQENDRLFSSKSTEAIELKLKPLISSEAKK